MGAADHGRDVPTREVVSNLRMVSMTWMDGFWTPASLENNHSIIVQEMVILLTPIKAGMEPGYFRYMAFLENQSSSGNSCAAVQVAREVSRPSVQVLS